MSATRGVRGLGVRVEGSRTAFGQVTSELVSRDGGHLSRALLLCAGSGGHGAK